MAGTKSGGRKAAITCKKRYGPNFYFTIGKLGGMAGVGSRKGFAGMREEKHKAASSRGGRTSRRVRYDA